MEFRGTIMIWGWVQKYHPEYKFFIENVVFDDMKDDWAEVCDALGQPIIVCSDEIRHTKRNRAYWTNIDVPEDWRQELRPRDPDTCMDPGRTVQSDISSLWQKLCKTFGCIDILVGWPRRPSCKYGATSIGKI